MLRAIQSSRGPTQQVPLGSCPSCIAHAWELQVRVVASCSRVWQIHVRNAQSIAILPKPSFGGLLKRMSSAGEGGEQRMSALHALAAFLTALTNANVDGRVIVDAAAGTLRFVLLNAAAHFTKASTRGGHDLLPVECTS